METWDQRAEGKPFPTAAVLGGLALSLFMAALDATTVSTAMPKIAAGLGSFDHYTWPFTSYLLTCTLATLLCGACATRFGHKRVFACGISVFAVASAGCALSNGIDALTACSSRWPSCSNRACAGSTWASSRPCTAWLPSQGRWPAG